MSRLTRVLPLVLLFVAACGAASGTAAPQTPPSAAETASPTATPPPPLQPLRPRGGCGSTPPPPRTASVVSLGPDGRTRWDRAVKGKGNLDAQALPVVQDGRVYVAVDDRAMALDERTGEVLWSSAAAGASYGLWLDGDRVIVSLSQVGRDGRVLAFDKRTGDPLWVWRMGGTGLLGDQLLVGDGLAMVNDRGTTQLLDLASGRLRWQVPGPPQVFGLGVADGVVVRTIAARMTAYSADTGTRRWTLSGLPDPAVVHGHGDVLVVSPGAFGPRISGDVTGVAVATGKRLWRFHDADALDWGGSGAAGELLYRASSGTPEAILVDTHTGREVWRARTQIALYVPAVVSATTVTTIEGGTSLQRTTTLVVRAARDGRVLGRAELHGAFNKPDALADGVTAAMLVAPRPGKSQPTVAAFDGQAKQMWTGRLPRFARGLVAQPDGGAVALTVDPVYACAA